MGCFLVCLHKPSLGAGRNLPCLEWRWGFSRPSFPWCLSPCIYWLLLSRHSFLQCCLRFIWAWRLLKSTSRFCRRCLPTTCRYSVSPAARCPGTTSWRRLVKEAVHEEVERVVYRARDSAVVSTSRVRARWCACSREQQPRPIVYRSSLRHGNRRVWLRSGAGEDRVGSAGRHRAQSRGGQEHVHTTDYEPGLR